jgi:hypothetical protein
LRCGRFGGHRDLQEGNRRFSHIGLAGSHFKPVAALRC